MRPRFFAFKESQNCDVNSQGDDLHFLGCGSAIGGLPIQMSQYHRGLLRWSYETATIYEKKSSRFGVESWQWLLSRNVDSNLLKTHPNLLIWLPLTTTSSRKWKRSSVVIILPQMMMLWMLCTTFWDTKMAPSTQKWSVCSMTARLSMLM